MKVTFESHSHSNVKLLMSSYDVDEDSKYRKSGGTGSQTQLLEEAIIR